MGNAPLTAAIQRNEDEESDVAVPQHTELHQDQAKTDEQLLESLSQVKPQDFQENGQEGREMRAPPKSEVAESSQECQEEGCEIMKPPPKNEVDESSQDFQASKEDDCETSCPPKSEVDESSQQEQSVTASMSKDLAFVEDPCVHAALALCENKRLYNNLLDFLAANPEGVLTSKVISNVKGFLYFLMDHAKQAGLSNLSPAQVLRNTKGVRSQKILDGRCLFFPEGNQEVDRVHDDLSPQKHSTEEPKKHSTEEATDASIVHDTDGKKSAIDFLRLAENEFGEGKWPKDMTRLKSFLIKLERSAKTTVLSWRDSGGGLFSDSPSVSKRRKKVLQRFMFHFREMGCVSGTAKALKWNRAAVLKILNETSPSAKSTALPLNDNVNDPGRDDVDSPETGNPSTVVLVQTVHQLDQVTSLFPFCSTDPIIPKDDRIVAIDCEGVPENIFLIQVATHAGTFVFDCVKLGAETICKALAPLLTNPSIIKLFHDLHMDAVALVHIGGISDPPLCGTLDTQLAMEALTGKLHVGFNPMLDHFGLERHPSKRAMKRKMDSGNIFSQRPLPPDVLKYAALDVLLLRKARDSLLTALGGALFDAVQRASDRRARLAPRTGGARQICFDTANSYAMASLELMQELRPEDLLMPEPLDISDDTSVLLDLLPEDLRQSLSGRTGSLSDIILDKGRAPLAWVNHERLFLGNDGNGRVVSPEDIDAVVQRLGGFGCDNRAGLERQLHRVSAIRNRENAVIGLTMRVGRHINGNAAIISDLLFSPCSKSILFLGEPGSGKTTVVREVTRLLAERYNVCIVDTSNEIAGDGDIPHPCVGLARRMMVPSLDKQSSVMIECVQNHTPEVMVIDEIGRPTEVEAARTCKQRGVRLIASAHGDLRKLIKNPKLRGLIGGVETVTLGDAQAKLESKKSSSGGIQKLKPQRAGSPTFDVIVELKRGAHNEWRIVLDAGDAVDRVLESEAFLSQLRIRDPLTGELKMELEKA